MTDQILQPAPQPTGCGASPRDRRADDAAYRLVVGLAIAATVGMILWGLGAIPLMSFNEARRAVPLQEMAASGDWLLPTLNGQLYIDKPPLLYWVTGVLAWVTGSTGEWVVRLPSAIAALVTAWWLFELAHRVFGRWTALFTLFILVSNAGFAGFARRGEIEMLLTALCLGSLLAVFKHLFLGSGRAWVVFGFFLLGLAVLTKGPVALLFVLPPLLCYAALERDRRALAAALHPWGWLVLLLVGSSWYLAVAAKLGLEPWRSVVAVDIVGKISRESGPPFYAYWMWTAADFLPWSLLLLAPRRTAAAWIQPGPVRFLTCAALVPLIVLSLFDSKHVKYLLPAYPVFALLFAIRAAQWYQGLRSSGQRWVLAGALGLLFGYLVFFAVVEARFYRYRFEALPRIANFLHRHPEVPVFSFPGVDPRVVYYHGAPIPSLTLEQVHEAPRAAAPRLLLVRGKLALPLMRQGWCRLASFRPYLGRNKEAAILGTGDVCR